MKRILLTVLLASTATCNAYALTQSNATIIAHHEHATGNIKGSIVSTKQNMLPATITKLNNNQNVYSSMGVHATLDAKNEKNVDDSITYSYRGVGESFIFNFADDVQTYDVTTGFYVYSAETENLISSYESTDTISVEPHSWVSLSQSKVQANIQFPRPGQYEATLTNRITQLESHTESYTFDDMQVTVTHANPTR